MKYEGIKMKKINVTILLIIICTIINPIYAQETSSSSIYDRDYSIWLDAGLAKCHFGPTIYSNLTVSKNDDLLSLRYLNASEFRWGNDAAIDHPDLEMYEIGLLYGRELRKKAVVFTIEGGIGYIHGIDRGSLIQGNEYTKEKISNICIPIESRIRLELCRYIGIGVFFIGNINAKKSFSGGGLDIQIGCF